MSDSQENCSHPKGPSAPRRQEHARALKGAFAITATFMLAEFIGGIWTNSLALMADAGHMLTDAAALALSLFAIRFSQRPATSRKTYGYFRVEILAALANGSALFLISGVILYESYHRFLTPEVVRSREMLWIAVAGLIANLVCIRILHADHKHNLNIRGAFLHVIGDLLGSVAAILAALAMIWWQVYWPDPVVSVLVSLLICFSAWRLMRESVEILLEGAPAHVSVTAMRRELCLLPGVESVHDLHVWTLTSGLHAMTCHAVIDTENTQELLHQMNAVSRNRFNVSHTTIQLETEDICSSGSHNCH